MNVDCYSIKSVIVKLLSCRMYVIFLIINFVLFSWGACRFLIIIKKKSLFKLFNFNLINYKSTYLLVELAWFFTAWIFREVKMLIRMISIFKIFKKNLSTILLTLNLFAIQNIKIVLNFSWCSFIAHHLGWAEEYSQWFLLYSFA